MSKLRSINTSIWSDTWFEDLETDQKLLFIYLITNDKTNMLGVYETSIKKISFETGISKARIEKSFDDFEQVGKIKYQNNRVVLLNFLKHQNYNLNMKISAVRCYNELPKELKSLESVDLEETKQGFETLCQGFGMVRKIEVEIEREYEEERELEIEFETEKLTASPKQTKFEISVQKFKESLFKFTEKKGGQYPDQIVQEFFNYWSEANSSKTKMKWQLEKTFEVEKRLTYWVNRNKNFNQKSNHGTKQDDAATERAEFRKRNADYISNFLQKS